MLGIELLQFPRVCLVFLRRRHERASPKPFRVLNGPDRGRSLYKSVGLSLSPLGPLLVEQSCGVMILSRISC